MPRLSISPVAREELNDILAYVRSHNRAASARMRNEFRRTFKALSRHPHIGESCDHFGADMRRIGVGNYIVFYRAMANGIEIVRIIHGARNWDVLF